LVIQGDPKKTGPVYTLSDRIGARFFWVTLYAGGPDRLSRPCQF